MSRVQAHSCRAFSSAFHAKGLHQSQASAEEGQERQGTHLIAVEREDTGDDQFAFLFSSQTKGVEHKLFTKPYVESAMSGRADHSNSGSLRSSPPRTCRAWQTSRACS